MVSAIFLIGNLWFVFHCLEAGQNTLLPVTVTVYLFCLFFQSVFHESGHLMGGCISGYQLLCLHLGPCEIQRDFSGDYRAAFTPQIIFQCVMTPKRKENSSYFAYNCGGIIANMVSCACAVALYQYFPGWDLLAAQWIYTGIQKIILNALPYKRKGVLSDGYHLMLLTFFPTARQDYFQYMQQYGKVYFGMKAEPPILRKIRKNDFRDIYYREMLSLLRTKQNM